MTTVQKNRYGAEWLTKSQNNPTMRRIMAEARFHGMRKAV